MFDTDFTNGDVFTINGDEYAVVSVTSDEGLPLIMPEIVFKKITGGEPEQIIVRKAYHIIAHQRNIITNS